MKERFLNYLTYIFVKLLSSSYRYRYYHVERFQRACKVHPTGAYMFCIWHQNLFASIMAHEKLPHITMASPSKDGRLITKILEKINYQVVRGSSSREGKRAALGMIKQIRTTGIPAALTIDGPKGPAKKVKMGALNIAKATQIPLVPLTVLPEKAFEFDSWDRFRLPLPFSKIHVYYSEPIPINKDLGQPELEKKKMTLRQILIEDEEYIRTNIFPTK